MPQSTLSNSLSCAFPKKSWVMVALAQLVVVAVLGLFLRYLQMGTLTGINFKFLLHAHSHVALLGWLYSAAFLTLVTVYLPPAIASKRVYGWQFWLSQGAVVGMLVSFPVQGYAAASITFSTLHILLSYWFIYQFLKDAKATGVQEGRHQTSFAFVRAALFFLALSSLGPWAMGPIMATGHSGEPLYYNAIYFYLHFQYNGWFTFAVLGLLFWWLEHLGIVTPQQKRFKFVFHLFFWACLPAYLLSVLWVKPAMWVYWVGGVAGALQVAAGLLLLSFLWPQRSFLLSQLKGWPRAFFLLSMTALALKLTMQLVTAFPYMAQLAFQVRHFIIGYLHLVLIGGISFFFMGFMARMGWLAIKGWAGWGLGLFVAAFILSEGLLFLQGIFFWLGLGAIDRYALWLFLVSVFLPVGVLLLFAAQRKHAYHKKPPVMDS
ncbi:hypothetical protein GU926_02470 [Nibribacter ruber]|uniref:Uncharacterized protein n=1 Tax=Nibribacter ruber TaxID=2698458 RepID=A0A6P1NRA4_9BACT|nr:hypothetical protein [Nibribacter ruber]QHL86366.1 hypothetical protein GU926_02470 [Nibribacter ruber]